MAAVLQVKADKTVSTKFESVDFDISSRQTLDDIVSSPQYFMNVTKTLPVTVEHLKRIAYLVKTEIERVINVSPKREERMIILPGRRKAIFARSPLRREFSLTDIFNDQTSGKAYLVTDTGKNVLDEDWKTEITVRRKSEN